MKYILTIIFLSLSIGGCGTQVEHTETARVKIDATNVEFASTSVNGYFRNDFQPAPYKDLVTLTTDDFIFVTILRTKSQKPDITVTISNPNNLESGRTANGTLIYSHPAVGENNNGLIAERFKYKLN